MTTTSQQVTEALERIKGKYPKEDEQKLIAILTDVIEHGKSLKDALKYTPEMLEEIYGIAQRNFASGNYKEASLLFNILISLDDTQAKYFMGAGACSHMQKKYKDAVAYYQVCSHLDITDPLPAYHAADCYLQLDDPGSAFKSISLAVLQSENNPQYRQIKERAKLMQDGILKDVKRDVDEVMLALKEGLKAAKIEAGLEKGA
jgi:type III secretion system low calcium response chaperone LcrH/SycD